MRYWLMKSEPEAYGIDDLARDKVTAWWGVRNYQARNFMRDQMQPGDRGFFYHSNCAEPGIVGIVEVCKRAYPDATQFDRIARLFAARLSEVRLPAAAAPHDRRDIPHPVARAVALVGQIAREAREQHDFVIRLRRREEDRR